LKFSPDLKDQIIEALLAREAGRACPRCGNEAFVVLDGFFNERIDDETMTGVFKVGGPVIPCIGAVCNRCGFLSKHALGSLGLLVKEPQPEDKS
jgi:ribosomal protein S27AE